MQGDEGAHVRRLTEEVVVVVAPDELEIVRDERFPQNVDSATAKGPLGLGLEIGAVFIAPFIYAFFEAAVKQAGQSLTSEIIAYFRGRSAKGEIDAMGVAEFLERKGFDPQLARQTGNLIDEKLSNRRTSA